MVEKIGVRFAYNEVKISIIELILDSEGPINEPSIRDQLHEKYGAADQGLTNRQLHSLELAGYVESITPVKKSRYNYWDIRKIKTLKNIRNEFPGIQLKDFTKAKDLIIKINFHDNQGRLYKKYFIYISLFPSLYDTFLNNEFKQLLKKADALWKIENYRDQDHKRHILYDKICRHFYETDFLTGKTNEDAKKFVDELEERIKNVNDAYNTTPSIENPHPGEKFQAAVDELDALYDKWYEKCLKKDQSINVAK